MNNLLTADPFLSMNYTVLLKNKKFNLIPK